MRSVKVKQHSGEDIQKYALPLVKIHLMFGSFFICIGIFAVVYQISLSNAREFHPDLYPIYTGAAFCISTGMAATALALVEGFSEMAIGVIIFDIVNASLAAINLTLCLNTLNIIHLIVSIGLQITVIILSIAQVFLLFAYLCPICSKARHEYEEAEDYLVLTLEGEYFMPPAKKLKQKSEYNKKENPEKVIPKKKEIEHESEETPQNKSEDKVEPKTKPDESKPKTYTKLSSKDDDTKKIPSTFVYLDTDLKSGSYLSTKQSKNADA